MPIPGLLIGLGLLGGLGGLISGRSKAKQQQQQLTYQQRGIASQIQGIQANLPLQQAIMRAQAEQQRQAINLEIRERQAQAQRDRAFLGLSAAEANVTGATVGRQQAASAIDVAKDTGILSTNLQNILAQNLLQRRAITAQAQTQISQLKSQKGAIGAQMPDIGLAGLTGFLGGATGGLQTYLGLQGV